MTRPGFSLEDGPLPVQWHAGDGNTIAACEVFDVRLPVSGTRTITAAVTDAAGQISELLVGRYDNATGQLILPPPGY